jgi:hypothetical protein
MKKIILHSYQLGSRGTEICLYKYAKYLREFLGVDPIIVSTSSRPTPTLDRFKKEFKTYLYDSVWKPDGQNYEIRKYFNNLIEKEGVDFLYAIKGGEDDGILKNLALTPFSGWMNLMVMYTLAFANTLVKNMEKIFHG